MEVGIVGSGGRSVTYAKTYSQCDDVDIVAIADPVMEHRKALAKKAGLEGGFAGYL